MKYNYFISYNLVGFESLSEMKMLETLDLGFNLLNQSILQSLSALTSLKNLIINNNQFEGSFPVQGLCFFSYTVKCNLETVSISSHFILIYVQNYQPWKTWSS